MREEILSIASDLREGSMTTDEAKIRLLVLFGVIKLVCEHRKTDLVERKSIVKICLDCGCELPKQTVL